MQIDIWIDVRYYPYILIQWTNQLDKHSLLKFSLVHSNQKTHFCVSQKQQKHRTYCLEGHEGL